MPQNIYSVIRLANFQLVTTDKVNIDMWTI